MEKVWVVVPCYNEQGRLDRAAFASFLDGVSGLTLLFVDDGSTDRTAEVLDALVGTHPARAEVLSLATNRGKAEAVRLGMRRAVAEGARYIGFWDADLATPLAQIPRFAAYLEESPDTDVVMGSRVRMLGHHVDRFGVRHLIGRVFATLASFVLGLPVYDTQCGAKLFRSSAALAHALENPFLARWSFDVELLQRLQRTWGNRGIDRMVEVPLPEWRDVGSSKVSFRHGAAAFVALFVLLFRGTRTLPSYGRIEVGAAPGVEGIPNEPRGPHTGP